MNRTRDRLPGSPDPPRRPRRRYGVSLAASGEPMLWLGGGALAICLTMIAGLFALVLAEGLATFWPAPVTRIVTRDGRRFMGEITRRETATPGAALEIPRPTPAGQAPAAASRRLVRTGNYRLTQAHFQWVDDANIAAVTRPEWALVVERLEWGRFYGVLRAMAVIEPLPGEDAPGAEARARLAQITGQGEKRVAILRPDDGGEQAMLVMPDELDPADRILGVARVFAGPEAAWEAFGRNHPRVREEWRLRRRLERVDTGAVNRREEKARLAVRRAEMAEEAAPGPATRAALAQRRRAYADVRARAAKDFAAIRRRIDAIDRDNHRYQLLLETAGEGFLPARTAFLPLDQVVRAYPPNRLGFSGKAGVYLSRWWEFLTGEPREANSQGGVFPAIFGTVVMTLLMSVVAVPFGVLAALYLREYARAGLAVSAVRIAVNNLAGVPSIVFGVFGLGFFCYMVGGSLDQLLFAARLPNPTFGKGGILWAALTLALLTLPVVIVATEEALSAVPDSMREGSYACGASKWQTIRRIVLPCALPGIITGMILAIARGAGEVAPLMLVGAVKLAPELALDRVVPFLHPERSFMHLGFHIYDVGFQSQNSEAAKPMLFTTTLLLIAIIAVLNLGAVCLRSRLRRRFATGAF
ncbi:MAG: phosphate ABC transporter permease PstA [Acidobacteriota bacterium]